MTTQNDNHPKGSTYEIRIKGYLSPEWSNWLDGLSVTPQENNETLLTGSMLDQAALHGVLAKVRDLNLVLILVKKVGNEG